MKARTLLAALVALAVAQALIAVAVLTTGDGGALTQILVATTIVVTVGAVVAGSVALRDYRRAANARATRLSNVETRLGLIGERAEADRASNSSEVRALRKEIDALRAAMDSSKLDAPQPGGPADSAAIASLVALGRAQDLALDSFLSQDQAVEAVRAAVRDHSVLEAVPFLEAFPGIANALSLSESRTLLKSLRRLGYLRHAMPLIESIAERFGNAGDVRAAELYASELALYDDELSLDFDLPPFDGPIARDTVLHLVGKALPETQSGYTLRTQYTAEAQQRLGINPVVVAQSGASDRPHEHTETYEHRGIRYYLLGGPQRGSRPWGTWVGANVHALADVVRMVRPAAIHAHSDFMNSLIALPVARAYGIPLVNETRGFWEESWLSRTAHAEGWRDLDALRDGPGLPEMYRLRVEREAQMRSESDAVITLARVMRQHIETVGDRLELPPPTVDIAPNAVETADFPVVAPNPELREELGLDPDELVIGYISSIVEYEGIDTLIRGMVEIEAALDAWGEVASLDGGLPTSVPVQTEIGSISSFGAPGGQGGEDAVMSRFVDRLRRVHLKASDADLGVLAQDLLTATQAMKGRRTRLLIVGDGAELRNLRTLSGELELERVLFTGRVPHDQVIDYYSLIDLFIVPRKRAAVTELVTPLKPFEAMSTGRPCMFSDVGALAEIAADSGCVELFRADDHHSLAMKASELLSDPMRLEEMARAGAEWVRAERTWDRNAQVYAEVYSRLGVSLG